LHVLFSFIPLMTLTLAIFGFLMGNPQSAGRPRSHPADHAIARTSSSIRFSVSGHSGAHAIELVGLIWASSGMFGAVRSALNIAWDFKPQHGLLRQTLLDVGATLGLGILMVVSMAGTLLIHLLQRLTLSSGTALSGPLQIAFTVAGVLLPAVISFVAFLLIYREVPNAHHLTSEVWPGALVATVLFELSKHGFAFYVSHFNHYQALYGVLGGVMLFMLWVYTAAIILLIGAEFASELEKGRHKQRIDDGPLAPSRYASRGARV
jgi:membrane protein